MFINLYPASRGPSIFLDKFGRLKEPCVTKKKTGTHALNESSFEKPAYFIFTSRKDFKKHNSNHSHRANAPTNSTCVYNLSKIKFKFLGDKKRAVKGYYLEVWKIDSAFLHQVYLLNYHNCFYICEGLYNAVNNKRLKHDLE